MPWDNRKRSRTPEESDPCRASATPEKRKVEGECRAWLLLSRHVTTDARRASLQQLSLFDTQIAADRVQVLGVSLIVCFFALLSCLVIAGAPCAPPSPEGFVCLACR